MVYDDNFWDNSQQHLNHTVTLLSDVTVTGRGHIHTTGVAISVNHPGYYVNIMMNKVKFTFMQELSSDSALEVWIKNCNFLRLQFFENHYWKSLIKTDVPNTLSESSAQCTANIFIQGCTFEKMLVQYWKLMEDPVC